MRDGPLLYVGVVLLLGGGALLARATEEAPAPRPAAVAVPGAGPTRIVSATLGADEMLLALLGPEAQEQLAALSTFADDPAASNVTSEARAIEARVHGDAERILSLDPDLIVTGPYTRPEAMALLSRSRVPVLTISSATSVRGIEDNLRTLGGVLGREAAATAVIDDMRGTLRRVRAATEDLRRPRVLLYNRGGYTPGAGTLFDELLDIAGADNAARELGLEGHGIIGDERLLALDPEVILVVEYVADGQGREVVPPPTFADAPVFESLSAVKSGAVHRIAPQRVLSESHHAANGAVELARLLHPGAL
ncbi:MAG: hypothetical protein DRJ42_30960 [Deltaproteobacteria bacterium]|nr:MAG: hypothetical protein DRJ42_30960 [Deltaproteobacteria bacterium]